MKILLLSILLFVVNSFSYGQPNEAQYTKRISAFDWMPEGRALLLNVMTIDKSQKSPPVPTKYLFDIESKKIETLPIDGSGLAAAPDGKSVAYVKRVRNKDHIYLYDFASKQHRLLLDDTLKKFALGWSPDGKYLVYNAQLKSGAKPEVAICIFNLFTGTTNRVTSDTQFKSYGPVWNPKNDKLVYFLDKGDRRDQIYLTDSNGTTHTNITNDTTTHNYSPAWLNEDTVLFIQSPDYVMTMQVDGNKRHRIEAVRSTQIKFNARSMKLAYLDNQGDLFLFDWETETTTLLINTDYLNKLR